MIESEIVWEAADGSLFGEPVLRFARYTTCDGYVGDITFRLCELVKYGCFRLIWSAVIRGRYRFRRDRNWLVVRLGPFAISILLWPRYVSGWERWTMRDRRWRNFWRMYSECRKFKKIQMRKLKIGN